MLDVTVDDAVSSDTNRPTSRLGRVASFTITDRLKNVIRQRHHISDSEGLVTTSATAATSAAAVSGCQRCVQV